MSLALQPIVAKVGLVMVEPSPERAKRRNGPNDFRDYDPFHRSAVEWLRISKICRPAIYAKAFHQADSIDINVCYRCRLQKWHVISSASHLLPRILVSAHRSRCGKMHIKKSYTTYPPIYCGVSP